MRAVRGFVALPTLLLGSLLVATAGPAAGSTGDGGSGGATIEVTGVVEAVVVDAHPRHPDAHGHDHDEADDHRHDHRHDHGHDHAHGDLATTLLLDVGGAVVDLPAGTATAGDRVTVRLADAPATTSPSTTSPSPGTRASAAPTVDLRGARVTRVVRVQPSATTTTSRAGSTSDLRSEGTPLASLLVLPVHFGAVDTGAQGRLATAATSAADFWGEQSGGRIVLTPDVRPSQELPRPSSCSPAELWNDAVVAHGVRAENHRHVAVWFPSLPECPWVGLATLGGNKVWVNGALSTDVLAHEIGHNLGLGHANTARCTSGTALVPLSPTCLVEEYGDLTDVMGHATGQEPGSLSTAFAYELGLVRFADASPVGAVTVDLAPLQQVDSIRALRLRGRDGRLWFLEHRPAAGRDERVPAWAGVQLRELRPARVAPSTTLTMGVPPSSAALRVGAALELPGSGFTVRVVAADATGARVQAWPTEDVPPRPDASPGAPVRPDPVVATFTDVPLHHPFHLDVEWLSRTGVTTGYADGSFRPSSHVSRDAMAAFLSRHAGALLEPGAPQVFTDVPPDHPFALQIAWMASAGLSTGNPDGSFGTRRDVSRAAMAAFLHRYAGRPAFTPPARSPFRDVPTTHPFYLEITWLAQSGITTGYPDGTFRPGRAVKRDTMAAFLHRMDGIEGITGSSR